MFLSTWLARTRRSVAFRSRPPRQARPSYRPHLDTLEGRVVPSTFLVTNTNDAGAGSFRQAILDANATPGTNEIDFAIGDGGAQVIRPTSDLPGVGHSVIIDGTTQPGYAGVPLIDIDGSAVDYVEGLSISADNCTIRGLAITNFRPQNDPCTFLYGLYINGSGNVIVGNYIGTDANGATRAGNSIGVMIGYGSNNRIGGTTPEDRNVISGNDVGIDLFSNGNVVQGNYIGTDATGTHALGNGGGVVIGGSDNLIGGTTPEARNLISGNTGVGLQIVNSYHGPYGQSNRVEGNYIGTDVTGTQALGNYNGVNITEGADNLIGGTEPGAGNLISGNQFKGVEVVDNQVGNLIQGNLIGTDVTGTQALGNGYMGVYLGGSSNNLVGGTEPGAGNVISGNGWYGISISSFGGTGNNLVQGNFIGTDITGTQPLGNGRDGVHIDRDNNNTVGGEAPGAGNVIAFNGNDGVLVDRSTPSVAANGNAILGNAIFANGNLGIELLHGANHDQAAPVITSATTDNTGTTVTGTLTSTPNTTFTLEIFASSADDPSGAGERLVGSVVVTTDADGNASFTVTFDTALDPGVVLTATATDAGNNTSAFSAGAVVSA
jgi:titin